MGLAFNTKQMSLCPHGLQTRLLQCLELNSCSEAPQPRTLHMGGGFSQILLPKVQEEVIDRVIQSR